MRPPQSQVPCTHVPEHAVQLRAAAPLPGGVHSADPPDAAIRVLPALHPLSYEGRARLGEGLGPIWSRLAAFEQGRSSCITAAVTEMDTQARGRADAVAEATVLIHGSYFAQPRADD
jgi:hypothetical protein